LSDKSPWYATTSDSVYGIWGIPFKIALEESKREVPKDGSTSQLSSSDGQKIIPGSSLSQSVLDDLLSLGLGDVFNNQQPGTSASTSADRYVDPWSPGPSEQPSSSKNNGYYIF